MTEKQPESEPESLSPETLSGELRALLAAVRPMISTEISYQSARAGLAGKAMARIAGWGALILAVLFFVLMALIVGLLFALAPLLGRWGALAVVLLALLLLGALAGLAARAAWRRLMALLRDGNEAA
ncbi:MAG: hypothetical protein RLY97_88 [Pseudomonadota bacterium]|jgi:uncharacterized membrane protein YqjE